MYYTHVYNICQDIFQGIQDFEKKSKINGTFFCLMRLGGWGWGRLFYCMCVGKGDER
jgi:hypothetical protein